MISWTLKNEVERGKGTKFPTAPQDSQTFHKMNFQTPPENPPKKRPAERPPNIPTKQSAKRLQNHWIKLERTRGIMKTRRFVFWRPKSALFLLSLGEHAPPSNLSSSSPQPVWKRFNRWWGHEVRASGIPWSCVSVFEAKKGILV